MTMRWETERLEIQFRSKLFYPSGMALGWLAIIYSRLNHCDSELAWETSAWSRIFILLPSELCKIILVSSDMGQLSPSLENCIIHGLPEKMLIFRIQLKPRLNPFRGDDFNSIAGKFADFWTCCWQFASIIGVWMNKKRFPGLSGLLNCFQGKFSAYPVLSMAGNTCCLSGAARLRIRCGTTNASWANFPG